MSPPRIAIVGASADRAKFGNKAVRAYAAQGWDVLPVHPSAAEIEGCPAYPSLAALPPGPLARVSFYVPPAVGLGLLEQAAALQPGELWVNPGAESDELLRRAAELGLRTVQACAILDIGASPAAL